MEITDVAVVVVPTTGTYKVGCSVLNAVDPKE